MPERSLDTPIGRLTVTEDQGALTRLAWGGDADDDSPLLRRAEDQVLDFLAGRRQVFDLPLRVDASDFQRRVCDAMLAIPYGETRQYGDLSRALGVPAQAIGQACGGNPLPILIPCHRVLGARGLGGFSGGTGIETKVWLLRLEGAASLLI
ncbi:methylated-DNA--[protein]-cysteine S-methyltransferase [Tropicibacter oceani]|uniref:Methylated-DNA--protein-cysteine methyltransferase n=1 Tax=Tropicibacter oceani TaxID=3058420 RepID=A0ABY8QGT4_9RHOB|nr:methylated-DNA--[protein]-cysteine S-methyltransferase [Tropicibacter oceani]WGW03851.1 methylated-DNA--[protein]-cysteine S-methyltransferase [Tropicibacter oceani]